MRARSTLHRRRQQRQPNPFSVHPHFLHAGAAAAAAGEHVGTKTLDDVPRVIGWIAARCLDLIGVQVVALDPERCLFGDPHGSQDRPSDDDRDVRGVFRSDGEEVVAATVADLPHRDLQVGRVIHLHGNDTVAEAVRDAGGDHAVQSFRDDELRARHRRSGGVARRDLHEPRWQLSARGNCEGDARDRGASEQRNESHDGLRATFSPDVSRARATSNCMQYTRQRQMVLHPSLRAG